MRQFKYQLFVLCESSLRRNPFVSIAYGIGQNFKKLLTKVIAYGTSAGWLPAKRLHSDTCATVSETCGWSPIATTKPCCLSKTTLSNVHFACFEGPPFYSSISHNRGARNESHQVKNCSINAMLMNGLRRKERLCKNTLTIIKNLCSSRIL